MSSNIIYIPRRERSPEFPCTYHLGQTCVHGKCRLATLPAPIATRLQRNWSARDYLDNWGKLLYDPKEHGRDAKRRQAIARIVRAMRNGTADYGKAAIAGAWMGAAL